MASVVNLMIIAMSSNNLCRKNGMKRDTQPLIREFMSTIDDTALKTAQRVFVCQL